MSLEQRSQNPQSHAEIAYSYDPCVSENSAQTLLKVLAGKGVRGVEVTQNNQTIFSGNKTEPSTV